MKGAGLLASFENRANASPSYLAASSPPIFSTTVSAFFFELLTSPTRHAGGEPGERRQRRLLVGELPARVHQLHGPAPRVVARAAGITAEAGEGGKG